MCQGQIRTDPKHIAENIFNTLEIFHKRSDCSQDQAASLQIYESFTLRKQNGAGRANRVYFLRYLQRNMEKIASH